MRDWAEVTEDRGGKVPAPRRPEAIAKDREVHLALANGAVLASAPMIRETGRPVKANLSLDAGVLAAIDAAAARQKLTRSAFLELIARRVLNEMA